jgi:hypothetical protein
MADAAFLVPHRFAGTAPNWPSTTAIPAEDVMGRPDGTLHAAVSREKPATATTTHEA